MYKKGSISNGLQVMTQHVPQSESVTILCLVGAGSRYEVENNRGISHFLEHMFFKGGASFKNAREVASAIDSIGGDFNAFTGKEYAGYYVKCAVEHIETASEVLSDMLVRAVFKQEEIEKERGVILEELNMYLDTPMYQVSWNFEHFLFGDQALGWDTIGTKELINTVNQDDFLEYKQSLYVPENTVIAISGGIEHKELMTMVEKNFSCMEGKQTRKPAPLQEYMPQDTVHIFDKKTEQGHFVLGGKAPAAKHEDAFVLKVLSVLCGGMMSSRMFLNIREAKGLCYYISTSTDDFTDVGIISTRAGIDVHRVEEAVEGVLHEYKVLRNEKVQEEELQKAKNYLLGKMKLRLEDSEEVAHMLGKQLLLYGEVLGIHEIEEKICKVTIDDIHRLAKQVFAPDNLYISLIGPFQDKKIALEKLLERKK
jgi:predicted Zn-dependent peptidase